jgi:hypothetical protein
MNKIAIGFTGTRDGMTIDQCQAFAKLVVELGATSFHHGDCVGADADAHDLVRKYLPDTIIIAHPGSEGSELRAHKQADVTAESKPFLERNRDIVDLTNVMIAAPNSPTEKLRSGTWSTMRYAAKQGKKVYVINPNGTVTIYRKKV